MALWDRDLGKAVSEATRWCPRSSLLPFLSPASSPGSPQTTDSWGWAPTAMQNIPSHDCLLPLGSVPLAPLTALHHGPGATSTCEEMAAGQVPLLCIREVWRNSFFGYQCLGTGMPVWGTGEWLLTPSLDQTGIWNAELARCWGLRGAATTFFHCLETTPYLGFGKIYCVSMVKKSFAAYAAPLLCCVRKLMKAQIPLFLCFEILWWSRIAMHSEVSLRVYK